MYITVLKNYYNIILMSNFASNPSNDLKTQQQTSSNSRSNNNSYTNLDSNQINPINETQSDKEKHIDLPYDKA